MSTENLKSKILNRKSTEGHFSSRSLLELSLLSTFLFVFAALLLQFLLTLQTAFFLKMYDITFRYSLFAINYLSESSSNPVDFLSESSLKWSEDQLYFITGMGPVILTVVGFLLLFFMKKVRRISWKTRLALTWMAFLLVNALPCGLLAGVFFYDGFGVAFHWLVSSFVARMILAVAVLLLLIFFSRFWQRQFLKASCSGDFVDSGRHQRTYIKNVFFKPWIYGFFILLLFNWPFDNLFWRAFLLSFGYMAITLFDHSSPMHRKPHIRRSDNKIFANRLQPLWFALALALVWVADYLVVNY
ncbi:MAG: hypothetical protein NT040_02390 [Bacteroidetes bacterium]|nr:hypothetical protein [Bacteroidota bacterium]